MGQLDLRTVINTISMNYLRGPNGNWRSSNSVFGKLARSFGKFLRCIPLRHFRFFLFFSQVQRDGWDLSTDDESARSVLSQVEWVPRTDSNEGVTRIIEEEDGSLRATTDWIEGRGARGSKGFMQKR